MTASNTGNTLTLTHASDVPAATYYFSVKEDGKTESDRLALTVGAYVAPPSGGGGSYTPPVKNEVDSGKDVTASDLKTLANDGKTLTVTGKNGEKLVLDSATVKALAKEGGKLTVTVADGKDKLNEQQAAQVGNNTVYDLSAALDGKTITSFGGKVTVSLPYALKDGEKAENVKVWYLASNGTLTQVSCTYDAKTKLATFTTDHFSAYMVGVKTPWINPFTDVTKQDWFYDAVATCHQLGLMNGTSETSFEPNANTTRAMIITVLYNMAGKPDVTTTGSEWYAKAQAWAMAKGISDGTNMEGNITREQLVTMLWRNAGSPMLADYPGLSTFADAGDISSYAQQAMAWAHQQRIVSGKGNGILAPQAGATRAEVATMMMNVNNVTGK